MTKTARKERLIWLDIMITLVALELMSCFYYGLRSIVLGGVCIAVSLITEILCLRLMNRQFTADDLTCTSDALIIALMMPATMDYGIAGIACVFAVVAAKNVFGGRRNIIFSPAAAAYIFMLTSWEKKLLLYPQPHMRTGIFDEPEGLVNSVSYVYNTTGKMNYTDFELLMGNFSGPAGSVSILMLLIGAAMLILRRDISAGAFLGTITGTAFLSYIVPASPTAEIRYTFVTNMVLFAAVYIISDRRIAPKKEYYAFFYGLFIAVFSYVIVLTTGKENAIVIVSVLFTPVSLGIKNLEKKIELAHIEASETAAENFSAVDTTVIENSDEKTEDTSNE
ncbi:MAG: RnfABCDGE type electron transport complex subunit D [Ruminococcus sp.]|nr:RnfABCDGE type electron transport complex subunit D [Ruminococcus sp.]MBQ9078960.1 RnfABCDGE type electron transport complex subunit D [Ruminococcus sp.]